MLLVNRTFLLQKFAGKGGWTYALIPEIVQNQKTPFGWMVVSGSIDAFELKKHKLMPMGNGKLFLPVKAAIRKKIGKQAGDYVKIVLYVDESKLVIPSEILDCFENETAACYKNFLAFTENEQKVYLDWIYSAKTAETKAMRILKMMDRLQKNLKFYDKKT